MIGQTEFCATPQCTKHTYGACIIIVHMHGAHVRFFACEKSEKFRDRMRCHSSNSQRTVSCTDVSRLLINFNLSLNTLKLDLELTYWTCLRRDEKLKQFDFLLDCAVARSVVIVSWSARAHAIKLRITSCKEKLEVDSLKFALVWGVAIVYIL